ncbi:MAG TPA: DUF922 domain-containing protein [Flavobacterium sp.]|nr:DUF922 domain-containing protein [Flavobacterium sp.]
MKIIFLSIAFFALTIFNNSFSQDTINWRPDYKLTWKNFQGTPDSSSEFAAVTYAAITYSLDNTGYSFSTRVNCFFDKKNSWVKFKSDTLLLHEQGHFNIAEIFARKLRKAFSNYKYNSSTIKQDLRILFQQINIERSQMDSLYDQQTNFSGNTKMQEHWNKKIAQELLKLEQFR